MVLPGFDLPYFVHSGWLHPAKPTVNSKSEYGTKLRKENKAKELYSVVLSERSGME
jgi:hypothetical protein